MDEAELRVNQLELPAVAKNYGKTTEKLIGLCAALAATNPSRRFFLSSHDAAERFGIEPVQTRRLLKMLVLDGVLERLEKGNQHRAARVRFITDLPSAPKS